MAIWFFLAFGAVVALNYFLACRSKDPALKFVAFLISCDFAASLYIQLLTESAARPFWMSILDFCIILLCVFNRQSYEPHKFFSKVLPLAYLVLLGLNVARVATRDSFPAILDISSDVIVGTLLVAGLWGGIRHAVYELGGSNDHSGKPVRAGNHHNMDGR